MSIHYTSVCTNLTKRKNVVISWFAENIQLPSSKKRMRNLKLKDTGNKQFC